MCTPIEAVRGMRDVLPDNQRELERVRALLEEVLCYHGYMRIDLPIVEHRDLYLRKLGEELVGKVYEFEFGGRNLALRPEWTASVLRAYITHLQDQPLPLRLSYSGPVFRYERPQRFTYRQFTQIGVEMIGGLTPRADAETLALACAGLDIVGIRNYHIVIGHIGLIRDVLMQLGLAERTQGLLIWSLERMRTQGIETLQARLRDEQHSLPLDPSLLHGLDDEEASALLLHLLQSMQIDLAFGTRPPEAIVDRLLRKLRRDDSLPRIESALTFLKELIGIRGTVDTTLPQVAELLRTAGMTTRTLDDLQAILNFIAAHGISHTHITLDFGLGRGLQYYTGMIFEIYDDQNLQLCGGGRYDDLVSMLGNRQSVPAVGFAYGLERVFAAMQPQIDQKASKREVLVAPVADTDYTYAIEVAQQLRARGYITTVDVRGRTITGNLRDAARRNITYVAIVGTEERAHGKIVWRDLTTREERHVLIDDL